MKTCQVSSWLRGSIAILSFVLFAVAPAQTVDDKPEVKSAVLDQISGIIARRAYVPGVDFTKWPQFLAEAKPKIDAAKNDEEFVFAVNTALSKFGTTHLDLLSPRHDQMFMTGSLVGIGVTVQRADDGSLVVIRTIADAPAARGGIMPGDAITEVDGKKVNGTTSGIVGPEGTDVDITIKHRDARLEHFILTRRSYSSIRPAELQWIDKDTAKIAIYTFDNTYSSENVNELMMQASKAKNLILDLRDNGGGAVVNMEHLLGMLIPAEKPIGVFVDRSLVTRYTTQTKAKFGDMVALAKWSDKKEMPHPNRFVPLYHGNIVVLLNGSSGSASEISAAALRDQVNATIVGTKSAGAVLVSVVVPATNGFGFQYPLEDFLTVKGVRLEGNGIVPDVLATEPKIRLPGEKDDAVDKAMTVFAKAANKDTKAIHG